LITEETRWSREGISARRTRNQGRLRRLTGLREERQKRPKTQSMAELKTDSGQKSGRLVSELNNVSKGYASKALLTNFSTRLMRGDRLGIIGPNGAGKTTLLKLLSGDLEPDTGNVRLGTNLQPLLFDQTAKPWILIKHCGIHWPIAVVILLMFWASHAMLSAT
jgi:ATP-binding cassette subfamily F protein uup